MIYESGFFLMKRGNKIKHRDIVVSKNEINLRNREKFISCEWNRFVAAKQIFLFFMSQTNQILIQANRYMIG